jgi:hypothetical protein
VVGEKRLTAGDLLPHITALGAGQEKMRLRGERDLPLMLGEQALSSG